MIFSRSGVAALRFAYVVLLAGLAVGAFLVVGSYLYWQSEKKNDQLSQRALQELRGRLDVAKRDRDDLRGSEDTYKTLVARGIFLGEQRFDLIEALATLKRRHRLISLEYELAPQRSLRLSSGAAFSGVNLLASRVKLKIVAFHDADLVAFLDEFPRLQRGFFPLDRCAIKRGADPQATVAAPNPAQTAVSNPSTAGANNFASLEAECSLEWITLQTKGTSVATPSAGTSALSARPL